MRAVVKTVLICLTCIYYLILIPTAVGEGQWILSAVDENIDYGISDELYSSSISSAIGEIQITKEHKGTEGYEPYIQKTIMTWSPMPTTVLPHEKFEIQLKVTDGGSTPGYRNTGILSFSRVKERDYDFIASKYRGMEQRVEYTMPDGVEGDELLFEIEGSMGTKELPSAVYIYTYRFTKNAVQLIPINDASGRVILNTKGVVMPVASGTLMKPGDVLLSGADGKVSVSVQERGQIDLDKDTAAGIIDADSMVLFMGRAHVHGAAQPELILSGTRMNPEDQYLIYRLKSSLNEISESIASQDGTGLDVIRSNGGEFTVSIRDNGMVEVAVLYGTVEFEKGANKVTVQKGETLLVPPNGDPRIDSAVPADKWWKETTDDSTANEDSPAFSLGIGATAVVFVVYLLLRNHSINTSAPSTPQSQ